MKTLVLALRFLSSQLLSGTHGIKREEDSDVRAELGHTDCLFLESRYEHCEIDRISRRKRKKH